MREKLVVGQFEFGAEGSDPSGPKFKLPHYRKICQVSENRIFSA